MAKFGFCTASVRNALFNAYCTNYYGCPLWSFANKSFDKFRVAWRKCVRQIMKLSPLTRSALIPVLAHKPEVKVQVMQRFIQFFAHCLHSNNTLVALMSKLCTTFSTSIVADNVREVLYHVHDQHIHSAFDVNNIIMNKKILVKPLENDVLCKASIIEELCAVRDGQSTLLCTNEEVHSLLTSCLH